MSSTETSSYAMNHTMFRIKDPKVTVKFYEEHFGMHLLKTMEVPELGFTNYFLGFDALSGNKPWYQRQGVLELCHNHGAENDPEYKLNSGNAEPHRGFGHIAFTVDNVEECCSQLEAKGVKFQKRLSDGRQHNIAFALDPDGYWIELFSDSALTQEGVHTKSLTKFNHSMIRVKDPKKSLEFYEKALGMTVIAKKPFEGAKFTLYFLGYDRGEKLETNQREGLIELTHNWGTEDDADFAYHNGNDNPQGFGHFGITVDSVDEAMARFKQLGVKIKKNKTDGKMKFIGFVQDPDGYSIEILPRADIPKNLEAEYPDK